MKKSDLYTIYSLLFVIIASAADNRLIIGLSVIAAVLNIITAFILAYLEDKSK
jgi:Na+-driven multidrug efflux pump